MDDSVMQQHLLHYKQTTESAREELAALQAKNQSLHTQLLDCRSKLSSQEATLQGMRDAIERHKETEARQSSLISSLRERTNNTEQEMSSITSFKNILDMKLQALTKENMELKEKTLEMEIKSKEYFEDWKKTKQEATAIKGKCENFLSRLASKFSVDLTEIEKPMETIISLVELWSRERERQRTQINALEENVKSHEVECKASRETVKRLVADVDHEQKVSALRASDLNSVRQELECVMQKKQSLDGENKRLRRKLEESELALDAAREESGGYEKRFQDLEQKLLRSQTDAQELKSHSEAFFRQSVVLLGYDPASDLPEDEHILERIKEVCRKEKTSVMSVTEMKARLAEVLQEQGKQSELQSVAEQKEKQLQYKLQDMESELLTARVNQDGQNHEKQQYLKFLEQLSEKLKIENLTTDLGFDMRLEAILARAEQLTQQEGTALVENKTLVYSLQKKLKEQKQRLDSKELHIELLRRKVTQLDEEKRSRSALAVERDDATLASKKLQKKVERLQAELSVMRLSTTELKAQLSHTNELKIRVMEQDTTIEEQSKNLDKLKKNKVKAENRLTTVKTELHNQELRAKDELQQAQGLLHSQASAITELTHREKKLLDFFTVVSQMLGVHMPASMPSSEVIKRLEVLLHSGHHLPLVSHCIVPHQHHMDLISDVCDCSTFTGGSLGTEACTFSQPPTTTTP
ncbi:coiled-coil domain-containing protein 170 [Trichomycterus rosablanca]|uniref:coiled-coil domain-containing protein 170 n=1 Tax=Trichomycterus rosablanca TaxID=2290929 RepID=UPI002F35D255